MKGSSKHITFPTFITLYQSASINETLTSDAIPEEVYAVSASARLLLNKNHPLGFVLVMAQSKWARACARSMMLQLFHWEEEPIENNGISLYSKYQLAYNETAQPYHWLYCEQASDHSQQRWLEMLGSLCFAILVEESCLSQHTATLESIKTASKTLSGSVPSIHILSKGPCKTEIPHFKYIDIGDEQEIASADPQFIQTLFQSGKTIQADGRPFQCQGKPTPAALIQHLLEGWERKLSKIQSSSHLEETSLTSICKEALITCENKLVEDTIESYRSKMTKLQEGKKTLPIKVIKNTHEMALEHTLKSIQKNMLFTEDLEESICEAVNEELKQIVEAASESNYQWGKEFLSQEFNPIQARVSSKEIKTCIALKQEALIFRDFFHKKAQQLGSRKLDLYFEEFLISKLTECSQELMENEKADLALEVGELRSKLSSIQIDSREQRKILTKRNSDSQSAMETLLEKVSYYENRQGILEATITQLKRQISELESSYDEKLSEMQTRFLSEANTSRRQYSNLSEQAADRRRQMIVLESEIDKQKLLHQQSKTHYQALLKKQKEREEQLEFKIQSLNMQNLQELEQIKRQSERSLSESAVSKVNYQREFQKVCEELRDLNSDYERLEERHKNLQYELEIREKESQVTHNELEIALKKAEQKSLELESRLPRYLKYQQDYEGLQKIVDELTNVRKHNEKQNALLSQECLFMNETIAALQAKAAALKSQNTQLKECVEQLEQKQVKKSVVIQEWVQTDFQNRQQQQLEEALRLTQILEQEYSKLKRQMGRQSRGYE